MDDHHNSLTDRKNGLIFVSFFAAVMSFFFLVDMLQKPEQVVYLPARINPNTAEVESLSRLPGLGPAKAEAIVNYRRQSGKPTAFEKLQDLQKVKGIGPKTVENIERWIDLN